VLVSSSAVENNLIGTGKHGEAFLKLGQGDGAVQLHLLELLIIVVRTDKQRLLLKQLASHLSRGDSGNVGHDLPPGMGINVGEVM